MSEENQNKQENVTNRGKQTAGGATSDKRNWKEFVVTHSIRIAKEIKSGFVEDEGASGYRRITSRIKNLWKRGLTGKVTVIIGVLIILNMLGSCFDDSSDMKEIKGGSSGQKLADSSTSNNSRFRKGLTVKGFYIGMDLEDAKKQFESLIGKKCECVESSVSAFYGDNNVIQCSEKANSFLAALAVPSSYMVYSKDNKITEITFDERAVNIMFNVSDMNAQGFVQAFADSYNIPMFELETRNNIFTEEIDIVWSYTHPDGVKIDIYDNKAVSLISVASATERKFD